MPHTRNVALLWDEASSEPLDATQLQLQRRVISAHLHLSDVLFTLRNSENRNLLTGDELALD